MNSHGALRGFVLRPVEDGGAQMNHRAVQTKKPNGERERGLGRDRQFDPQMRHQGGKQFLVDLPVAVQIGAGKCGVAGRLRHAEMHEFAFAHLQAFVDFAEALRLPELAEQHRHE